MRSRKPAASTGDSRPRRGPRRDADLTPRASDWKPQAIVATVAIATSAAILPNAFTLDDVALVLDNPLVHGLGRLGTLLTSPFWPAPYSQEQYRPVASILLAIQYAVGGGQPLTYRLVTIALYVAACLAVLSLARRILPSAVAVAVAALFTAHPVHTEALAFGVTQNELIVTGISAFAVSLFLGRRAVKGSGRLAPREWATLALLYATAALAKEQGLLLPALLIIAELCFGAPRTPRERLRVLGPGFAILASVAASVLLLRATVLGGLPLDAMPAEALAGQSVAGRALTMLGIVPHWIRLLVWPAHLRVDYNPAEFVAARGFGPMEWLGALLVLAAVLTMLTQWRRNPAISFGLAWLAVTMFPVSNVLIPTGVLVAERTLFGPSIGMLIAMGGIGVALERSPGWRRRRAAAIAAGLLVLGGGNAFLSQRAIVP